MGKTSEIGGLISAITTSFPFSQSNFVSFADGPFSFSLFSSSNPSPSPQSSLSSSSVQSQPSTLPQSTTTGNLELLGMVTHEQLLLGLILGL
jgi:ATPase family AAA domain-containing protein 3A/B